MDIRLTIMMSVFATVLVVSGCASTEETRPASGPSMKFLGEGDAFGENERNAFTHGDQGTGSAGHEAYSTKRHRDPHRHEQRSASSVSSGDIERSFTGSACSRRTDVPT